MNVTKIEKRTAYTGVRGVVATVTIDWPTRGEVTYYKWNRGGWNSHEGIDCSVSMERELNKLIKAAA
jgi:hypothetical protein